MTKTTVSTAGGAMTAIDRSALMTRAWAIFQQTYKYPQIKFSDIGRNCFAWALRQAWVEAREAARLAAMTPAATKSANCKQRDRHAPTGDNRRSQQGQTTRQGPIRFGRPSRRCRKRSGLRAE